jgi:hypothetical protein
MVASFVSTKPMRYNLHWAVVTDISRHINPLLFNVIGA